VPALLASQAKSKHRYNEKMCKSLIFVAFATALRTGHGDQAFAQITPTTPLKG